jgi:hypothetical protein
MQWSLNAPDRSRERGDLKLHPIQILWTDLSRSHERSAATVDEGDLTLSCLYSRVYLSLTE